MSVDADSIKQKWGVLAGSLDSNAAALMERFVRGETELLERLEAKGSKIPAWVMAAHRPINPPHTPLISVQPMSAPVGGIAFYRPRYGSEPECIIDALATLDSKKPVENPYKRKRRGGEIAPGREGMKTV